MIEAPYTLDVHLASGQTITARCTSYSFSRVVEADGGVRMKFGYDPVEGDPVRVDYINGSAVVALVVTSPPGVIEADEAERSTAAIDDG